VPGAYTHVYVVIPVNQKTGSLSGNYYIIDGTIQYNNELPFTKKDDVFMNEPKLAIHGLASPIPAMGCPDVCSCNQQPVAMGGFFDAIVDTGFLDNLFGNIFQGISCINSTYTPNEVKNRINNILSPFVESEMLLVDFNNPQEAITQLQNIMRYAKAGDKACMSTSTEDKWSECSRSGLKSFAKWWNEVYERVKTERDTLVSQLIASGYRLDSKRVTYETKFWDVGDKPNTYEGDIGLHAYGANYDNPDYATFEIEVFKITSLPNGDSTGINPSDVYDDLGMVPDKQHAGFGTVSMLLLGGIAAGAVFLAMKNKKSK